ncbi:hypothetical protein C0Q70_14393 [Pomacea canaliculata]|uniref:BHLH domain-containing protein n=1 Tax=Pomacea canaliculata TaxID=400727 RepID=A0A2T7NZY4_POMCA|nr:hypothetical protein C0Q70_14393 [Pomacea canaliculata]
MEVSSGYLTASTSTSPDSSSSDTFDSYAGNSSTEDSNPSASTRRQSSRLKAKKRCDVSADSEEVDGLQSAAGGTGSAASATAPGRCRKRTAAGEEKYNLRLSSLVKRVQVERKHATPKEPKGKSKPPPLSKYRRRTANARERMRMRDINEGFERLKSCLPEMEEQEQKGKKEKVTKFTILSLALNYIHALRQVLGAGSEGVLPALHAAPRGLGWQ